MNANDWPAILELDLRASSIVRADLLKRLASETGAVMLVREKESQLTGHALLRLGRIASYIGPIIAEDPNTAATLLRAAVAAHDRDDMPLFIDTATKPVIESALLSEGFEIARTLTRMGRSPAPHPMGYSERVHAIAGLELC
jgi:hypothetical protein